MTGPDPLLSDVVRPRLVQVIEKDACCSPDTRSTDSPPGDRRGAGDVAQVDDHPRRDTDRPVERPLRRVRVAERLEVRR
jgi:hypothetical protein